jgi:hypothetical protein
VGGTAGTLDCFLTCFLERTAGFVPPVETLTSLRVDEADEAAAEGTVLTLIVVLDFLVACGESGSSIGSRELIPLPITGSCVLSLPITLAGLFRFLLLDGLGANLGPGRRGCNGCLTAGDDC